MLLFPLLLLFQAPTAHAILEVEHARAENVSTLLSALKGPDSKLQRLAARAIGRLERPALADALVPLLRSEDAELRREALGALAQTGASFDFVSLIAAEKVGAVRAVIYESLGRVKPPTLGNEEALAKGLSDEDTAARTGAARGLESFVRLNNRTHRLQPATLEALRKAVGVNAVSRLRQFALLALNAASGQDEATTDVALRDDDPQVRRLGVMGSKRWVNDPSPMVRFEAMRVAGTCERATAALLDPSEQVILAAVDALGTLKCDTLEVQALVDSGKTWRIRSRALVSLAKVSPEAARSRLSKFKTDPTWQVRAYAATAAALVKDEATLGPLARDPNPNVATAALSTVEQATHALRSDHSGHLLAAAAKLKGAPELAKLGPLLVEAIQRLTRDGRATVRDARIRLIELLGESGDLGMILKLQPMLTDRDPNVAALVAKVLSEKTGKAVEPSTMRYRPEPFPTEARLRSVEGARAVITMKGLGAITVQLLPEEAPATVDTFVSLAERGAYNGLTFHRVVPNFVLQGGSPGADEYDALTTQFMRDELGFASHVRGTFGISTRGHDTGDGQIFINLVDNWRLDHTYTVFARVTHGMEVVDSILEGDVIEKVQIQRVR